jgi:hypothetical protein
VAGARRKKYKSERVEECKSVRVEEGELAGRDRWEPRSLHSATAKDAAAPVGMTNQEKADPRPR